MGAKGKTGFIYYEKSCPVSWASDKMPEQSLFILFCSAAENQPAGK